MRAQPKNGMYAAQSTLSPIRLCWCTRRTPCLSSAPLCAAVWSQQDNIKSRAAFFASAPPSRRRCRLGSPRSPSLLCLFQAHWQLLTSHTITRPAPRLLLERFFSLLCLLPRPTARLCDTKPQVVLLRRKVRRAPKVQERGKEKKKTSLISAGPRAHLRPRFSTPSDALAPSASFES